MFCSLADLLMDSEEEKEEAGEAGEEKMKVGKKNNNFVPKINR